MPTRRFARSVLHTALAITVAAVALPTSAHAAAAPQVKSFAASDIDIANPERGFYRYSETHLSGDPATYQRLDPVALAAQRTSNRASLVFRYFYLDGYAGRDTIAAADLELVRADLVAARRAGVKMIVRFAYSSSSSADAPAARVVGHIRQLAPVLNQNADVIAALQAGFIGRWGEWYYTDNFADDPAQPWKLTDANWQARQQVLGALLSNTTATIPVQVRYPAIRQRMESTLSATDAARLGVHNDCFLAGTDDYGTFTSDADRDWLATKSRTTLTGGESCDVSARSGWTNASAELAKYHFTYLNAEFQQDVLNSWGAGRAEADRRLGYRLRLVQTTTPAGVRAGQSTTVRIRLSNTGYAAPITNRPVNLIVKTATRTSTIKINADMRTWAPGQDVELTATFLAPATAGKYQLLLNLPDPSGALSGQQALINGETTNSAYAVRLANPGLWTAQGWNDLQTVLNVTTA
jgi:uncharacterized protein DUF4832/uncharacterized protein DUF4874